MIQALTVERTRRSIAVLLALAPTEATVLHDDHEHRVPVARVNVDDVVRVRPGERLPVDGKVIWVTPVGAQGNRQAGIGVQLADGSEAEAIRNKIETLLAGTLNSEKPTQTM